MTLSDIYLQGLRRAGSRVEIPISDLRNMWKYSPTNHYTITPDT